MPVIVPPIAVVVPPDALLPLAVVVPPVAAVVLPVAIVVPPVTLLTLAVAVPPLAIFLFLKNFCYLKIAIQVTKLTAICATIPSNEY